MSCFFIYYVNMINREEVLPLKIERKFIFKAINKNSCIIFLCFLLIFGTFFGTVVQKYLPNNINSNLYLFISKESISFEKLFLDSFCFPFLLLILIYLSGFSITGEFTVPVLIFLNGAFYGFENALKYYNSGAENIIDSVISFITFIVISDYLLIVMSESSVFMSKTIKAKINNSQCHESHYNAKNNTVKFITFTFILVLFSIFSSYISPIIHSLIPASF